MENGKFNFTYTAISEEERREVLRIKNKYDDNKEITKEDKLKRLKKLDAKVNNQANAVGLIFGVIGCLVFGLGLTCILEWDAFTVGVLVIIPGAVIMGLAYPIYKISKKLNVKKYGEEIITLSNELLEK